MGKVKTKKKEKLRKKNRYLKIGLALVIVVAASLVTVKVLASQSANSRVDNNLRIANLEGKMNEKDSTGKDFVPEQGITIGDSKEYIKDVKVENTGNTSFFVRVMVFPEIKLPLKDENNEDAPQLLPANIGKEVLLTPNADWIDGQDGYYYYTKKVPKGTSTSSLFKGVRLASGLAESYVNADFTIQIKSETISAANFQYRKAWWDVDPTTPPSDLTQKSIDDKLAAE